MVQGGEGNGKGGRGGQTKGTGERGGKGLF